MSIKPINSTDPNTRLKNRITTVSGAGLAVGTVYTVTRKNWLYKGMPSDSFVKTVSKSLETTMSSDELKEASRINRFLESVADPEVNLETLKPQIRDSKELSAAIKSAPDEPIESALTRVFSKPDKAEIKQELLSLQYKTISDKKADRNTSLKLIHDNFDAKSKKLVKSKNTSNEIFTLIKDSARTLHARASVIGGVLTGVAAGALCLVLSEVPGEHK
ncbi:MAG: hypothetical protein LUB59_04935 [Candidatus Gastranaerophilales bacterium]|nr:hypothetical protein [Candidatus Gastranaerophilales bacterium]